MRAAHRRRGLAVSTLTLVAVLAGGLAVVSRDRHLPERPQAAATGRAPVTMAHRAAPAPMATGQPSRGPHRAKRAKTAARAFLSGYLAWLHGRGTARRIGPAARELIRELRRRPPRVTPAMQDARTRIVRLRIGSMSRASARAVATLKDSAGPPYRLLVYLERRHHRWLITRIGDA